jgi:hypothetical protein
MPDRLATVQRLRWLFLIFCLSPAAPAFSQLGEHEERMLLLDARWQDDSRTLRINWDAKGALKSGGVAIDRRALGIRVVVPGSRLLRISGDAGSMSMRLSSRVRPMNTV